ncbi:MAG: alpha/beta hydrolase, partial [Candidatus Obscuribacterales bacterium]|nr:alpha/beta hydrolase [Candidatus Obscuribacterales bacterium]
MNLNPLKGIPAMALGSASLLAAVYIGFAPRVAKGLYTSMLFHPYQFPEGDYNIKEIAGLEFEDVYFKASDGTLLHGWYFHQSGSKYTVLMSHGNTGNIAGRPRLLESILKAGVSMFAYDYRGFGRSQGAPSVEGVIDDACAAFDFLVEKRGCSPENIVVYGESLGAAVTCQLTLKRRSRGMILQSGFASITKISKHHIPLMHLYPAVLFPQPLLDSVAVLRKGHPPLLIVHGHKDSVVPFSHGEELFASAV